MQTETQLGFKVRPHTWEEIREIFLPKYHDHQHWFLILSAHAAPLLTKIEEKYYQGEKNADLTVAITFHRGMAYAIVAARKRHMFNYQLGSLLRQFTLTKISDKEILRRDFIVSTPLDFVNDAADLLPKLLGDPPGNDLAMGN